MPANPYSGIRTLPSEAVGTRELEPSISITIRCFECSRRDPSRTAPALGAVNFGHPPGGATERWHVLRLDRYAGRALVAARQERSTRPFDPVWSFPGRIVGAEGKNLLWTLQPSWPVTHKQSGKVFKLKRPLLRCHECKTATKVGFPGLYELAQRAAEQGDADIMAR